MESGEKKFVVYKSSAGSGKTFTLVREYLQILINDPEAFRHILAVTFTNKAANEMKERILRYLKTLADPVTFPDAAVELHLLPALLENTGYNRETISKRAGIALRHIMHQYADFAVSTIDSFFHRVVRTFAHDLNIPLTFDVILEEKDVLEEIVSLLISRVGHDDDLTRTLIRFIQKKAGEEKSWDIEKDLVRFADVLTRESAIPYLEKMAGIDSEHLQKAHDLAWHFIAGFESLLAEKSEKALDLILSQGLDEASMAGGSRGIVPWLARWAGGSLDKLKIPAAVNTALEKNTWYSTKANREEKIRVEQITADLTARISQINQLVEENRGRYLSFKLITGHLYQMAVLRAMENELQAYRRENNILLISEFNRRIHDVVREQPVPFIYERLGERYRHFLVDEFQDTSILQWHNIIPLIDNSLAEGRLNLVVGDGKQAIYRFRSGDVRQFEKLPCLMDPPQDLLQRSREEALVRNFGLNVLKKNFRSAKEVVTFNNRLFSKAAEWFPEALGSIYRDTVQGISGKAGGYVHIEFMDGSPGSKEYAGAMISKVLETVYQSLARNYQPGDIAVLCRDNRNASRIAATLMEQGISVVSADSLALSYSREVNFLIAWLRHLSNPADEIARSHILYDLYLRGMISHDNLEGYLHDEKNSVEHAGGLKPSHPSNVRFRELIMGLFQGLQPERFMRNDLFHVMIILIRHFLPGYHNDPYILFFLDQVLEFIRKDNSSLEGFLEWWDDKGAFMSIVTPEGLNAVRVMTIHKSKGLEFPVVIYPFADQRLRLTLDKTWVDVDDGLIGPHLPFAYIDVSSSLEGTSFEPVYREEYEKSLVDMYNLVYVALTRARDQLYILSKTPPKEAGKSDSVPGMLKRFLIEEGLWNEGQTLYPFGEAAERDPVTSREMAEAPEILSKEGFAPWKERVILRSASPESWSVEDPDRSTERGNVIHYLLSEILTRNDVEKVLGKGLIDGIIDPDDFEEIRSQIHRLINDPSMAFIFDPSFQSRNETEILTAAGSVYRPDRLVFDGTKVTVVDFKTGRESERHYDQVKGYANILQGMGYEVKQSLIVYIGEKIVARNAG